MFAQLSVEQESAAAAPTSSIKKFDEIDTKAFIKDTETEWPGLDNTKKPSRKETRQQHAKEQVQKFILATSYDQSKKYITRTHTKRTFKRTPANLRREKAFEKMNFETEEDRQERLKKTKACRQALGGKTCTRMIATSHTLSVKMIQRLSGTQCVSSTLTALTSTENLSTAAMGNSTIR